MSTVDKITLFLNESERTIRRSGHDEWEEAKDAQGYNTPESKTFQHHFKHLSNPKNLDKVLQKSKVQTFHSHDAESKVHNLDLNHKNLEREKINRAKKTINSGGKLSRPIVLHDKKTNQHWLLSGNTSAAMQAKHHGNFESDVISR